MKGKTRKARELVLAALIAMLAGGLHACTADETFVPDEPKPETSDAPGNVMYFSMRLMSAEGADLEPGDNGLAGYQDGSQAENLIDFSGQSENVVILLDENYGYKGYTPIDFDYKYSQNPGVNYPAEAAYIGLVHNADPEVIYSMPDYGLLVLNTRGLMEKLDSLDNVAGAGIGDVLALMDVHRGDHKVGRSGDFFTMTSSAYLEWDVNEWVHSIIFKLDKRKIYETRMQALASPATTAIVERMAAKFSLTLPGADGGEGLRFIPDGGRAQVIVCNYVDGQPSYNNRTWNCTVDAWGINKYEPLGYFFRNIHSTPKANLSSYPYSYGTDINTTGEPFFNGWNNQAYHRCHWAIDPHYDGAGVYPGQYRAAVDNPEVNFYGKNGKMPTLGYLSYNELSKDFSGLGTERGVNVYSSENTFADERAGALWLHNVAGSEVIIGARIHINGVSETKADYDLFRNRIGVFYPTTTDFATYFLSTINSQLASQSSMTYRYYNWDNPEANDGATVMKTFNVDNSNYKIYYQGEPLTPEKMASLAMTIPATIENGDGKVLPWVEGMYIGRRNINPDTYEEEGAVMRLQIDPNDFKSLIYDWIGVFDHFNKGRMVYTFPILYRASKTQASQPNYRPHLADYGVVRNTWYHFAIDGINSLGSPIDDLDQKIIPYEVSLENSILVEMKVLDWHIFETDVTLPEKP